MRINNVSYQTKGGFLFKNISFNTEKDQFILIEGPNGSGKTTFLKTLLGICQPTSGVIQSNESISFVPDSSEQYFVGLSPNLLFEFLKKQFMIAPDIFEERLWKLREKFYLNDKLMNQTIQSLSLGEKKKVMIIAAFLLDSDIYLMDEPLSGLDSTSVNNFVALIEEYLDKGKKFIVVSHEKRNILPKSNLTIAL